MIITDEYIFFKCSVTIEYPCTLNRQTCGRKTPCIQGDTPFEELNNHYFNQRTYYWIISIFYTSIPTISKQITYLCLQIILLDARLQEKNTLKSICYKSPRVIFLNISIIITELSVVRRNFVPGGGGFNKFS